MLEHNAAQKEFLPLKVQSAELAHDDSGTYKRGIKPERSGAR